MMDMDAFSSAQYATNHNVVRQYRVRHTQEHTIQHIKHTQHATDKTQDDDDDDDEDEKIECAI